ncbi:MAG: 30S ribosomal protein S6 [Acidobacteriia bacterium]|nr:30S ribosomal protein S6 [Terriglobia bacterium]
MRIYEELFIAKPDATEEEIDAFNGQLEGIIKQAGGAIDKVEKWGVRRLAYRVQKKSEGYYVLIQFSCAAEVVKEVERRLRVTDMVLKYLTVRIDEKLKWLEKRKKARAKRAARRPAPAAAPPAMPAEAPGPAPGAPPGGPAPGAPVPGEAHVAVDQQTPVEQQQGQGE